MKPEHTEGWRLAAPSHVHNSTLRPGSLDCERLRNFRDEVDAGGAVRSDVGEQVNLLRAVPEGGLEDRVKALHPI
jgi:hypothetical protein